MGRKVRVSCLFGGFYGEAVWRKYRQRVEALVRPTVEGMGLRLWDVVFEKEGPDWYLRVLIDKTDGTTMDTDTCADVSHALDPSWMRQTPLNRAIIWKSAAPAWAAS